jgi:hypothetical protein
MNGGLIKIAGIARNRRDRAGSVNASLQKISVAVVSLPISLGQIQMLRATAISNPIPAIPAIPRDPGDPPHLCQPLQLC